MEERTSPNNPKCVDPFKSIAPPSGAPSVSAGPSPVSSGSPRLLLLLRQLRALLLAARFPGLRYFCGFCSSYGSSGLCRPVGPYNGPWSYWLLPPKSGASLVSLEPLSRASFATMQNYLLPNLSATERLFTSAKIARAHWAHLTVHYGDIFLHTFNMLQTTDALIFRKPQDSTQFTDAI